MTNGVSIIICTHNGGNFLPETIEHLNRLDVDPRIPWEVIIIDNNSTDGSGEIALKCWKRTDSFRVVKELKLGLIHARVRGISEAAYEYISFIDDDNWIEPDWINVVYDIFQSFPEVGICGGDSTPECEVAPPSWFETYQNCYAVGIQNDVSADITDIRGHVWGAGITFRKSAVEKLFSDGFSFFLTGRKGKKLLAGEDTELCFALRLQGWRIRYDKRMQLRHYIPKNRLTWEYLCKMYSGFGASHGILDIYQRVYTLPYHSPQSPFNIYSTKKKLLLSSKKNMLSIENPEGKKEQLEYIFYKAYLHYFRSLFFSYKKIYLKIQSFYRGKEQEAKIFDCDRELIFDQSVLPYLREGWSKPEFWKKPDGTKTVHYIKADGKKAVIVLPLNRIPTTPKFTMTFSIIDVYIHPKKLKKQRVTLYLNKKKIAYWIFTKGGYQNIKLEIPSSLLKKSSTAKFTFKLPDARSPYLLGDVPDKRWLSICIGSLRFYF